jgi:hypothetical protein
MSMAEMRQRLDSEAVVARLWTALQTVSDPRTYLHTGEDHLPSHRAALAERAKAMTGLYLFMIEGLIVARFRLRDKGIGDVPSMVHASWLRYLQLHGRQAAVLVRMVGWLCSEFPRELLTSDRAILGVLANSLRLGGIEQASAEIELPSALMIPAHLVGELVEDPSLARRIGALLTRSPQSMGNSVRQFGESDHGILAFRRLSADFSAIVAAGDLTGGGEYPQF